MQSKTYKAVKRSIITGFHARLVALNAKTRIPEPTRGIIWDAFKVLDEIQTATDAAIKPYEDQIVSGEPVPDEIEAAIIAIGNEKVPVTIMMLERVKRELPEQWSNDQIKKIEFLVFDN